VAFFSGSCAGIGQQRRRREVGGQQKIRVTSYFPLLDKKNLGVFEILKVGLAKA
jgi:hypothetical protein